MSTMDVHQSNLTAALWIAIQERERVEKSQGYTGDSGFTAGLRETLKHVQTGGQINIIPSD